jgi:hypothetical protein
MVVDVKTSENQQKQFLDIKNGLSSQNAETLTRELIEALPATDGENARYYDNAVLLLISLMPALCELRDRKERVLTARSIRDILNYEKYVELSERADLSTYSLGCLRLFLDSLKLQVESALNQKGFDADMETGFNYARGYFGLLLVNL